MGLVTMIGQEFEKMVTSEGKKYSKNMQFRDFTYHKHQLLDKQQTYLGQHVSQSMDSFID